MALSLLAGAFAKRTAAGLAVFSPYELLRVSVGPCSCSRLMVTSYSTNLRANTVVIKNRSSHFIGLCKTLPILSSAIRQTQPLVTAVNNGRLMSTTSKNDSEKEVGTETVVGDSDSTDSSESSRGHESDSGATPTSQNAAPVSDADVDRELLRYDYDFGSLPDDEMEAVVPSKELPMAFERGKLGVIDMEELVDLLRAENGRDICVIRVPKELDYVDYMVLVTGRSTRHIKAMAEYIKWTYKRKRSEKDPESVKIEGEQTNDWFAIDLGNIAVHLFLRNTRRLYDLETLWTVGAEHDEKLRQEAIDVHQSALQREDFSFDAELDRLRKLRDSPKSQKASDADNDDAVPTMPKPDQKSMENVANWHSLPSR